jgi:membrane protein DedA with SNARE-associated domain
MFESLLNFFQQSHLSLWGPFFVLLLCGLGLPIPEDIVLVAAGALAANEGRSLLEITLLMYAGVLGGDCITFFAGRHVGGWVLTSKWFQRILPPTKQAKVVDFFDKHGWKGLFLGRFLPGLRAPIFFTAGSMKVPYVKFLFFDGLAALISVPVFVWLGHWLWSKFHDDLEAFHHTLSKSQGYLFWGMIVFALVCIVLFLPWRRKRKELKRPSASAAQPRR